MKFRWFCIVLLMWLIFLLPCLAVDETFRSIEYGFSIDYPREATVDASDVPSVTGMDYPAVNIFVPDIMDIYIEALERNQRSLDDFKSIILSKYEDDYNVTELGTNDLELNGKKAIVVDSNLESIDGNSRRMRDILVDGGDSVYLISCRAAESKFRRANQTYFGRAIMSFRTFPINDTVEGNLPGFPMITGEAIWSSVALADINGDDKLEVVFGTNHGNLHALGNDGIDIAGFPVKLGDFIRSSPAVGDLNDDGSLEIVVGCDDRMLYAFKEDGSMLEGFPKSTAGPISSSPAIGDLDGDGNPEIIIGSRDGGIYAWHNDGSKVCGFPVITSGEIWSTPALEDLNGDGKQEITIGSKSVCNGLIECLAQYQLSSYYGEIYSLDSKGLSLTGFPKSLPQADDIGYSSPTLADVNQDGKMEIVIAGSRGIYVKTFDEDQEDVRGFPKKVDGNCQDSFIAVGDLDNDTKPEIVAGSTDGRLYIWRSDGTDMPGFPIQTGGYVRHVTLGDIDGDGFQEILGGSTDNRVHAWRLNGTEVKGFPKVTLDDIETAPTLADLENDGSLELVVGSNDGLLYAWKISDKYGKLAWPMIRQNLQHTGVAEP